MRPFTHTVGHALVALAALALTTGCASAVPDPAPTPTTAAPGLGTTGVRTMSDSPVNLILISEMLTKDADAQCALWGIMVISDGTGTAWHARGRCGTLGQSPTDGAAAVSASEVSAFRQMLRDLDVASWTGWQTEDGISGTERYILAFGHDDATSDLLILTDATPPGWVTLFDAVRAASDGAHGGAASPSGSASATTSPLSPPSGTGTHQLSLDGMVTITVPDTYSFLQDSRVEKGRYIIYPGAWTGAPALDIWIDTYVGMRVMPGGPQSDDGFDFLVGMVSEPSFDGVTCTRTESSQAVTGADRAATFAVDCLDKRAGGPGDNVVTVARNASHVLYVQVFSSTHGDDSLEVSREVLQAFYDTVQIAFN